MIGVIDKKKDTPSQFQPSPEILEITRKIKSDVNVGWQNLHKPFEELNNRSVIDRMNIDQRLWNNYVEDPSDDPDEAWRWHGIRPITRNKIITMAAHVTSQVLIPSVDAQNDADEQDEMFGYVMKWLMKWNIKESDYETSFLFAVLSAMVNPVTYMKAEFTKVMQEIKEKNASGELTKKQVVDEVLSGFHALVVPPDEILIANPYEFELQRQRFIVRQRYMDFDEAKAVYGDHPNFQFVKPGQKTIFNEEDGMFYDQKSDNIQTLVIEDIYYNRIEDTEIPFVGGIYMGDDDVSDNRIKHRDNRNAPKYPFAKTGFEPIDEKKFFYYKSAVSKLAHDQELVDRMWQMVMDGTFLSIMPPIAMSGDEQVNSSVVFPGKVSSFNRDTQVQPINLGQNLNAGYNALQSIEQQMTQSSTSDIRGGSQPQGSPTAFEISRIEQNANVQLGLFGKNLGRFVVDFGNLMVDDIIQHLTVAEAEEIVAGRTRLKFRKFILPDEQEGGKKVTRSIRFTDELMGLTDENQIRKMRKKLFDEEGGLDGDKRLYLVNPFKFSKARFKLSVNPDTMFPKNEQFERAFKLEFYTQAIQNPFVDQEAITRDFLVEPFAEGESEKYMRKDQQSIDKIAEMLSGQKTSENPKVGELTKQLTGSQSSKQLLGQVNQ